jgi:hypothetical protein
MVIEVAKPSREERMLEAEENSNRMKREWQDLLNLDIELIDEDGYPTEHALKVIERWHWSDMKGWFEFIKELWYQKWWGWSEGLNPPDGTGFDLEGKQRYEYHISTAGWSGNESLIRAMQANGMLWSLSWVQSRRGGHYIFELRD